MSQANIDRLVAKRSLVLQEFDDADVAGYWAKAAASCRDARLAGASAEGRFLLAYTACLQATLAVLAATGLRVKSTASHYKAFYAMQKLNEPGLESFAARFDELRAIRHASIYEPTNDEPEIAHHLAESLELLDRALPAIRRWIAARRPVAAPMLVAFP